MPDLEDQLRAALRYNVERVQPELDHLHEPRRSRLVPALAGVAAMLAVVGIVVAVAGMHTRRTAAGGGSSTSFTGRRWVLTSVRHGATTLSVPTDLHADIAFSAPPKCTGTYQPLDACSGEFAYHDGRSSGSGDFDVTSTGFTAENVGDAGFDGRSGPMNAVGKVPGPDGRVVVAAMRAVTTGAVTATPSTRHLTLSRGGYVLEFSAGGGGLVETDAPATTAAPPAAFAGYAWRLDVVIHDKRKVAVPAKSAVDIEFGSPAPMCPRAPSGPRSCPGELSYTDGLNISSGTYRLTSTGFLVDEDVATTAIGYAGHDPVVLAGMAGMDSITGTVRAAVDDQGHLDLTTRGYVLTFARHGAVTETPSSAPGTDDPNAGTSSVATAPAAAAPAASPSGTSMATASPPTGSTSPALGPGSSSPGFDPSSSIRTAVPSRAPPSLAPLPPRSGVISLISLTER